MLGRRWAAVLGIAIAGGVAVPAFALTPVPVIKEPPPLGGAVVVNGPGILTCMASLTGGSLSPEAHGSYLLTASEVPNPVVWTTGAPNHLSYALLSGRCYLPHGSGSAVVHEVAGVGGAGVGTGAESFPGGQLKPVTVCGTEFVLVVQPPRRYLRAYQACRTL